MREIAFEFLSVPIAFRLTPHGWRFWIFDLDPVRRAATRYIEPRRLDTMPSQPSLHASRKTISPSKVNAL